MAAPKGKLSVETSYNISAMNFTPAELAEELRKHIPELEMRYVPDQRQQIADNWPQSVNDRQAQQDWGWQAEYDLTGMVTEMVNALKHQEHAGHV